MKYPEDYINKIICGDCLEVMKSIPDKSVDLIITSPPYNINLRIRGNNYCRRSPGESGPCNKYDGFNDSFSIEEYFKIQQIAINEMLRIAKQSFYIIQPITGNKEALFKIIGYFSNQIKEILIWDKKHAEPAIMRQVLNSEYEFIIVFDSVTARQRLFENAKFKRGTLSNIFRQDKSSENIDGHSATFPIKLVKNILNNFSDVGSIILDPFLGSGTTAVACKQLGRKFIGIEIFKKYCEISQRRLAQEYLFNPI